MFRLLCSILIVHALLLVGMFEVYFKSPIIPGLPPVPCPFKTPAKRLVLFIGDGLRADHFFHSCDTPFLRGKVESSEAVTGISHTHLPTESRPGTVAIAAGVYEDPSAVFQGWRNNPVPVDSFFNRCKHSFAWGSPDIVHLFSQGAYNINASSYSGKHQSFDPQVALSLNEWVFNNFIKFLEDCKSVKCLKLIHSEKISFFFHFIGVDMAGHMSKPNSSFYKEVILQVDQIIGNLTKIIDSFYRDNKTAYVFTSDHGMTDWGSHGAGSPQETKTPLVVWGSGVRNETRIHRNESLNECRWALSRGDMHDVEQADIATLMSTLLGVELPTNSIGELPVPYLGLDRATIMSAFLLNARQLYVLFNHLASLTKERSSPLFFRPFTLSKVPIDHNLDTWNKEKINKLNTVDKAEFEREMMVIAQQIREMKRGIEYYRSYFKRYLLFLLTMSFLGLIALIFGYLCFHSSYSIRGEGRKVIWSRQHKTLTAIITETGNVSVTVSGARKVYRVGQFNLTIGDIVFAFVAFAVSFIHIVQVLPFTFYLYTIVPVILWWKTLDYLTLPAVLTEIRRMSPKTGVVYCVLLMVGVELLHMSFYYRWVLSSIMAALSISPWLGKKDSRLNIYPVLSWTVSSLVLAIFPLLPTVGTPKMPYLVIFSAVLYITVAIFVMLRVSMVEIKTLTTKVQILLMMAVVAIVTYTDFFLSEGGPRDVVNNSSWTVLVLACFSAIVSSKTSLPAAKLFNVGFACGIAFTILSSSFESLFLPVLSINLGSWVWLEMNRYRRDLEERVLSPRSRSALLPWGEVCIGSLYLFFIIFSFFGIGNINSTNSFNIDWVRCFIDVFSPFTMATLIVVKTAIPFFLVSCFMRFLIWEIKVDLVNVLLVLLMISEAMGLMFLYRVRNTGSWLDVGTSISHYVIMGVSSFIVVLTFLVAGMVLIPRRRPARLRRYAD